MTRAYQPPVIQPLIDRFGAAAVHEAWLTVHGWPATWLPSTQDAMEVQEFLEYQEKGMR